MRTIFVALSHHAFFQLQNWLSTPPHRTSQPVCAKIIRHCFPAGNFATMDSWAVSGLREYRYTPLTNPNCLRVVWLRPAPDDEEDIDCEIVEIPLLGDSDKEENLNDTDYGSGDEDTEVNVVQVNDVFLSDFDSSDDENNVEGRNGRGRVRVAELDLHGTVENRSKRDRDRGQQYEAVSWCWGREAADQVLRVHTRLGILGLRISRNLRNALWALRQRNETRQLWIDAICINQQDITERNEQVARMDKIYGKASNVCIWLGDGDEQSKLAMDFIKQKLFNIWGFDDLIQNREMSKSWAALISLMKRPWFSRRWVVQEIALSPRGGTLYCGKENVPWQDFADAVSLFVEVETATHRLSDMLKIDPTFGYIPDFVGDVSSLGASLLVYATSNLFQSAITGKRQPLSSLEYLVSRLSVFQVTQPRDTIYALLAISKDAIPQSFPQSQSRGQSRKEKHALMLAPARGFMKQAYNVDYKLPVIDVFKDFVEFSIHKADPTRALDIICRPWAPAVMRSHDSFESDDFSGTSNGEKYERDQDIMLPLPSWISSLSGAAFEIEEHPTAGLRMERQNADSLVGMPDESGYRNYNAAGSKQLNPQKLRFLKWDRLRKPGATCPEYSLFVCGFIVDVVLKLENPAANGTIPYRWLKAGGWYNLENNPPENLWRTLVADRGSFGRSPPSYFPRAFKEAMKFKAKTISKQGYLDTRKLISEGGCTIVAEFLRRAQEVIWNRKLMKTRNADEQGNPGRGRLGLVPDDTKPGFKVCILYGCSVPVILEEIIKTPYEVAAEKRDRYVQWKVELKRLVEFIQLEYRTRKIKQRQEERQRYEWNSLADEGPKIVEQRTEDWYQRPQDDKQKASSITSNSDPASNTLTVSSQEHAEMAQAKRLQALRARGKAEFLQHKMESKNRTPPLTYFRLVGECYMHGMMNGEAIAFQNRNDIPEQMFELR
jgi:hypothetical protein